RRLALERLSHPMLVKRHAADARAIGTEGMDIAIADTRPVDELDAELERRLRLRHQVAFVEPQAPLEEANVRQRRLADADGTDFFGFDPTTAPKPGLERSGERGRRRPARGPAAHDDAS